MSSQRSHPTTLLPLVLACLPMACLNPSVGSVSDDDKVWHVPSGSAMAPAYDMDYSQTLAARFGGELAGYVVNVLPVPEGVEDLRRFPVGTLLVQDQRFQLVGFVSPNGTAYRFDGTLPMPIEASGRDAQVAALFGRSGPLQLSSTAGLSAAPR